MVPTLGSLLLQYCHDCAESDVKQYSLTHPRDIFYLVSSINLSQPASMLNMIGEFLNLFEGRIHNTNNSYTLCMLCTCVRSIFIYCGRCISGETSPEFTANTDRSGTIHLNEEFTLQMELYFPGFTPDVTAMIHDSDGVEMTPEPLLTTEDRGNDLYRVTLTWTATAFDVYDINVKARSEGGSAYTRLRPAMVVCACQNGGVCDTSKLWKVSEVKT